MTARHFLLIAAGALCAWSALALETPPHRAAPPQTAAAPTPAAPAIDPRPFGNEPAAGGITVDGTDGDLTSDHVITVSFPAEMVAADRIDAEDSVSPVVIWPALDAKFTWRTQSQGDLSIKGPLIPGQTYRFRLSEGLRNLGEEVLPADAWGFEMTSPVLKVSEDYGEREGLNSRPQVSLEFNYPMRLSDVAKGIWFQDRASRQKYPVEILLNNADGAVDKSAAVVDVKPTAEDSVTDFRVRPLQPLPVDRTFDLVVDDVYDSYGGRTLPYVRVFPMGETLPLEVDYVAARNFPMAAPFIEIKFDETLDERPLADGMVTITPAVPNLKLIKEGAFITAEGDFDPRQKYSVTIGSGITAASGYGLAKAETWGATFHPKQAAIYFPDREMRARSQLGLRFAFYQVNTGELEWKLAAIPADKLKTILDRAKEFTANVTDTNGNPVWTEDGVFAQQSTELFVPAYQLPVIASGTVEASWSEKDALREIALQPGKQAEEAMLLEISGKDAKGRTVGNHAVIYFGDVALTRKVTPDKTIVRVARLGTGEPVGATRVSIQDANLEEIASGVTDAGGLVEFPNTDIVGAEYLGAEKTLQPYRLSGQLSGSGWVTAQTIPPLRGQTITDRTLYRPGQEVKFKGFVRTEKNGLLTIPANAPVKWKITSRYGSATVLAEGDTRIDANGSWNAAWKIPTDVAVGDFVIQMLVNGVAAGAPSSFQIQEFRNPSFSVICSAEEGSKAGESRIDVASQYFHGAPNAGSLVQWTATWVSDSDEGSYMGTDDMTRVDLYSEHAKHPSYSEEIFGETALDGNGKAVIRCESPFKDPGNRAYGHVIWKVDVTGPDGQTITGGTTQEVPMEPVLLGIKSVSSEKGKLDFAWDAKTPFAKAPTAARVELFHVVTKSVKERLAPNVYRYRNFDQYNLVEKREQVTDADFFFTAKEPGRYVAVLSPIAGAAGMPVSAQAFLEGERESEVPVVSDTQVTVLTVNSGTHDTPWKVGETAALNVLAPSGGVAWVTVETDRVLDSYTMPLKGNTSRIEIPIKPEYEPNVYVTVYLLRPGGTDSLAGEMFGVSQVLVTSPDRKLDVTVKVDQAEYEPRAKITGEASVSALGQPIANADLAIYAVDDSILTLGDWSLPQLIGSFFPMRSFAIATYTALESYVDSIKPSWLTMKGFVVGGGGEEEFGNVSFTRKEFKPLILWLPNVKTDAHGVAKFSCEAPDNLTRFRVIAVAQTKESQFGAGDATLNVTRNLIINAALPRFLREGDEVELRAVARQKLAENAPLAVRCTTGGELELIGDATQEVTAGKDAPAVVRFKARAKSVGSATVKFEVVSKNDPKLSDAEEITLPVTWPVILKKESVAGEITGPAFLAKDAAPQAWANGRGVFSFAMSSTPWLAKLMGLPYLLEYPHGCFEQKSSRLLAYTYLANLLAYLPESKERRENYEQVIADTLDEFEAGMLPDGMLPYWPSGVEGNAFVTIQAAWCIAQAEEAGFDVPERLAKELPEALQKMLARKGKDSSPTLRAFALFVLTGMKDASAEELTAAVDELFLQRDKLTGEGLAMLAISMHQLDLSPERQTQLVAELPKTYDTIAFNDVTFSSGTRTEALCTWARLLIAPGNDEAALRTKLSKLMESSESLSTQENLWLLVAFKALLKTQPPTTLRANALKPAPTAIAENSTSAAWDKQDLAKLASFTAGGWPKLKAPGSYVLSAAYRTGETKTPAVNRGFKIERVIKNLTDAARTGSAEAPFQLGDQLLISYRFSCDKPQSYVALEDLLPAGIEVVNPDLAMFGKTYSIPDQPGVPNAWLSHSEIRDQQTNLYFDKLEAGVHAYTVLARATAAGSFIWPATQISPMYDSRFLGRSPSSVCAVVSK